MYYKSLIEIQVNSPAMVSSTFGFVCGNVLALSKTESRFEYPSNAFTSNSKQIRIPAVGSSLSTNF